MGVRTIAATIAMGLAGCAAPAHAEWLQATSKHFVVYANTSPGELRRQATQLEYFDGVIRYFHDLAAKPEDAANKVTVYVTGSVATVQRLCGRGCTNVAGFYRPGVAGSVAFTPAVDLSGGDANSLKPRIVLFHEYAHHFLLGNYAGAYPAWFSEGYAEFVSTVEIKDDYVQIGGAAQHRAYSLLMTHGLSVRQLFDPAPRKMSEEDTESLYARGWLLTHYLLFDANGRQRFIDYLRRLNSGTPSPKAATEAFGDLGVLDKAIDRYLRQTKIPGLRVPIAKLPTPEVAIRSLGAGERALIDLRMQSDRGVGDAGASPVFAKAKTIAARYPDDAVAQGWLAEMAYDAKDDDAALAAADRALVLDPRSEQGLLYKAQVLMRRAREKADPAAWKEARRWIVKANRDDPNDALALNLYYASFVAAGQKPPVLAVDGLRRALELVPQDPGLRWTVARQNLLDDDIAEARRTLAPLAYDPHASADNPAARLMALLESGLKGRAALDALERTDKTVDASVTAP